MRLDRFLSKTLGESRSTVKKYIRNKKVTINGVAVTSESFQVDTNSDEVVFNREVLHYEEFHYYLINKPAGYVCANEDNVHPTIVSFAPEFMMHNLHTVGRLDKDTTGALLLTNNGKLTHRLISPKKGVEKIYLATTDVPIPNELVAHFACGIKITDHFKTLPATLEIVSLNVGRVTVVEGKFHQIKRMFQAFDLQVVNLHREQFAMLRVDDLAVGEYRKLSPEEVNLLIKD
ncbi:MAG: Ribosomal small subunit pseudouridine synthase A [Tenericutes bacterium ADurb.Bin239]|jgi:16S rRNA pseudouridine516 synthase|nr:MAG: Ribosomal small subunit pseudouridine synthase A [Tenericutes bacterium ADurb.Bin239]